MHFHDPLGQLNYPLIRALTRATRRLAVLGFGLLGLALAVTVLAGERFGIGDRALYTLPGLLVLLSSLLCRLAISSPLTRL